MPPETPKGFASKAAATAGPPRIPDEEVKERLVAFARQIGFDSCRVAMCAPPAHAREFGDWLREGAQGEMDYMQRGAEKRRDPQKILPGAQSIIVLALNYFQGNGRAAADTAATTEEAARGRIARYAWGNDYHDVSRQAR